MREILKNVIIDDLCNTGFTGIMYVKFDSGKITEVSRQPNEDRQIQNVKNVISFWQMRFRVLHDWKIHYDDLAGLKNQCDYNIELKQANIFEFTDLETSSINDYILHEIIHIAYEASRNDKDKNEIFTQDLTNMLKHFNKGG